MKILEKKTFKKLNIHLETDVNKLFTRIKGPKFFFPAYGNN